MTCNVIHACNSGVISLSLLCFGVWINVISLPVLAVNFIPYHFCIEKSEVARRTEGMLMKAISLNYDQ